jgi:hypothetical protein
LDQQHDGVVLMVESFCSKALPTCSREREKWRGSNWPVARVKREGGCTLALPYVGGWAASLAPPPSLGRWPKGEEWRASFPLPSRKCCPRVSPWAGRLGLRGLVHLAQVARTLPFRPTQASVKWAHYGLTLEPSRTLQYNTDKLQNLSEIQKLLSFI